MSSSYLALWSSSNVSDTTDSWRVDRMQTWSTATTAPTWRYQYDSFLRIFTCAPLFGPIGAGFSFSVSTATGVASVLALSDSWRTARAGRLAALGDLHCTLAGNMLLLRTQAVDMADAVPATTATVLEAIFLEFPELKKIITEIFYELKKKTQVERRWATREKTTTTTFPKICCRKHNSLDKHHDDSTVRACSSSSGKKLQNGREDDDDDDDGLPQKRRCSSGQIGQIYGQ